MHIPSLLRTATLALSLAAATTVITTAAFADTGYATAQQQGVNSTAPYDSHDFTVPESDLHVN